MIINLDFYKKSALVFLFFYAIILNGCYTYKTISQEQIGNSVVKVRLATKAALPNKHCRINVQVDSLNFRNYYIFYNDKILKQDFKRKGSILYRLTFDQNPGIPVSGLDSMVFSRVFTISDSLKVSDILNFKNATGFVIEKNHK